MTVPPHDDSPRRLFQQSTGTVAGSTSPAADPLALRQLVEAVVQETLTREFAQFLGAGPVRANGGAAGRAEWDAAAHARHPRRPPHTRRAARPRRLLHADRVRPLPAARAGALVYAHRVAVSPNWTRQFGKRRLAFQLRTASWRNNGGGGWTALSQRRVQAGVDRPGGAQRSHVRRTESGAGDRPVRGATLATSGRRRESDGGGRERYRVSQR